MFIKRTVEVYIIPQETNQMRSLLSSSFASCTSTRTCSSCSLSSLLCCFLLQCFSISFTALLWSQSVVSRLSFSSSTSRGSFTVTLSLTSTCGFTIKSKILNQRKATSNSLLDLVNWMVPEAKSKTITKKNLN